jgi:hypothetical protein
VTLSLSEGFSEKAPFASVVALSKVFGELTVTPESGWPEVELTRPVIPWANAAWQVRSMREIAAVGEMILTA